jgi:O-succinylbenzoate synthase
MFRNQPQPQLIIKQATLFAYKIPFQKTMQFKKIKLHCREGLILQLSDTNGCKHFAEIAPLPAFSQETYAEVKAEIIKILSTKVNQLAKHNSDYKSVQFALDSLFLKKNIENTQTHLADIDKIPLLQGNIISINKQYQALGHPNLIKLKVARESVENDIATFKMLCALNPLLKIRCDANQDWSNQQAEKFFISIESKRLDYIEEPTSDHQKNLQLADKYKIYLGLDETLQKNEFSYQHHHCIKAFIIKPTLIGSKHRIDHLVSIAKRQAIKVSFSSSFETIVGLQILKNLANHYLSQPDNQELSVSLGIDTLKYFKSTLLIDEEKIEHDSQQLELLWTNS